MSDQELTEDEREFLRLAERVAAWKNNAMGDLLAHHRACLAEAWSDGVSAAEDYCGADCYPVCKSNPWAKPADAGPSSSGED